jgi:hypothetical protein
MPSRDTLTFEAQKRPRRPAKAKTENQGEGNREADAQYRDAVRRFIGEGRVQPAAEKAVATLSAPLPTWWSEAQDAAWSRARDGLVHEATPSVLLDDEAISTALRYGVGAASFYRDCPEWSDRLGHLLREEWRELDTGIEWSHAESVVRRGWDWGRDDLRVSDPATP